MDGIKLGPLEIWLFIIIIVLAAWGLYFFLSKVRKAAKEFKKGVKGETESVTDPNSQFCGHCGKPKKPDLTYCPSCGKTN